MPNRLVAYIQQAGTDKGYLTGIFWQYIWQSYAVKCLQPGAQNYIVDSLGS